MEIISYIFMIIGGLFYLLGGLGVLRMPDVFNRIQAGTKATTLGAFALLVGIGISPAGMLHVDGHTSSIPSIFEGNILSRTYRYRYISLS